MIEEFKVCSKCKLKKKISEFSKHKYSKSKVRSACKCCISNLNHNATSGSNKEKSLFNNAKKRARLNNIDFSISLKDIIIPEKCPVLGIELDRNSKGKVSNNSPSIDRIDNSKGYIRGNIKVISWKANFLKNSLNIDEIKRILTYMESNSI